MEENFRKNQEFTIEMQRVQLERYIQMHNQWRERQMAFQVAKERELLYWFGSFYVVTAIGLIARYRKTKNVVTLSPLLPLSFMLAYQADLAYGSKIHRLRGEAENIMEYEAQVLHVPCGMPTVQTLDQARQRQCDEQRTRKVHELYI